MPARRRTFCPEAKHLSAHGGSIACVRDPECVCPNASMVREMVNVTVDGHGCYACEARRLPACTEAVDQCTPEECDCADLRTHSKHTAATIDGSRCYYCEPINGLSRSLGMQELALVTLLVCLAVLCHMAGRRNPPGPARGNLRMARRGGDRSRAIRVHHESEGWMVASYYVCVDTLGFVAELAQEPLRLLWAAAGAAGAWCHSGAGSLWGAGAGVTALCGRGDGSAAAGCAAPEPPGAPAQRRRKR